MRPGMALSTSSPFAGTACLLLAAGARRAAIPIGAVIETMRPLSITPLAGAPAAVLGVSLVRGAPTLVIDLGALLGEAEPGPDRWVALCWSDRPTAIACRVIGVRAVPHEEVRAGAATIARAAASFVGSVVVMDGALVTVLDARAAIDARLHD